MSASQLELRIERESDVVDALKFWDGDEWAARVRVLRLELADGDERWQVGGIADVFTQPEYRNRSLAAQLMERAVEHMRERGDDVSVLYGIDRFYHRFGYEPCGDEHWFELMVQRSYGPQSGLGELPEGWTVREFEPGDAEGVAAVYAQVAAQTPGACTRQLDHGVWTRLQEQGPGGDCRVVLDAGGALAAYGWIGAGFPVRDGLAKRYPSSLVFAELHAVDRASADAALTMARQWAAARSGEDVTSVVTMAPPGHAVREAATAHHVRRVHETRPDGGMMAVPLRDGAPRPSGWFCYLPDRF